MKKTGDVIMEALNYMREHGWCKNILEDDQGRVCALGALNKVMTDREIYPEFGALSTCLPEDFEPDIITRFVDYNNSRQDFSEIEEWFEKAAANEGYSV